MQKLFIPKRDLLILFAKKDLNNANIIFQSMPFLLKNKQQLDLTRDFLVFLQQTSECLRVPGAPLVLPVQPRAMRAAFEPTAPPAMFSATGASALRSARASALNNDNNGGVAAGRRVPSASMLRAGRGVLRRERDERLGVRHVHRLGQRGVAGRGAVQLGQRSPVPAAAAAAGAHARLRAATRRVCACAQRVQLCAGARPTARPRAAESRGQRGGDARAAGRRHVARQPHRDARVAHAQTRQRVMNKNSDKKTDEKTATVICAVPLFIGLPFVERGLLLVTFCARACLPEK